MTMQWEDTMTSRLRAILEESRDMSADVADGAKLILEDADRRVPKESGDLAATGSVKEDRGGLNAVGITYTSVYARWVHEHLHFKHPAGGEAKFLETALLTKGEAAINKAGEHFWERL